jgi:hypothetical protein
VVLFWSDLVLAVLTLLFGIYALVDEGLCSCLLSEAPIEAREDGFLWLKERSGLPSAS